MAKTAPLKRFVRHQRAGDRLFVLLPSGQLRELRNVEWDHQRRRLIYELGPESACKCQPDTAK